MRSRLKSPWSKFQSRATHFVKVFFGFLGFCFLPGLSGCLVGFGFPGEGFPWISAYWLQPIALAPLFFSLEKSLLGDGPWASRLSVGQKFQRLAARVLVFGCVTNLIAFWWTTQPAIFFGGIPVSVTYPAFVLYALLSASFFLVLFAPFLLEMCSRKGEKTHPVAVIPLAFVAVSIELLCPRFFFWTFGSLTHGSDALNQWSSIFGFGAMTFFVLCSGVLLGRGFAHSARHPEALPRAALGSVALWAFAWGVGAGILHWGNSRLEKAPLTHVAWVQPNFTFDELSSNTVRSGQEQVQSLENLLQISREALQADTLPGEKKRDLLVWPESVAPSDFAWNKSLLEQAQAFVKETGVTILAQGVEFNSEEVNRVGWRNAAMKSISFLLRPDGSRSGNHEKWIPIPFGESVPFEERFPKVGDWLRKHVGNTSKVARGKTFEALAYSPDFRVAPLICFDAIEPSLARKQAREGGASLFVNQSNFVWMGNSNAGFEFLELTRFRALENGRSMILAANTGPSVAFDPLGRTVSGLTPLLKRGFGRASLPVVDWTTPYQIWGQWPLHILAVLSILTVTFTKRHRRH